MTREAREQRDLYLRIAASREAEPEESPEYPPRGIGKDYPDDWPDAPAPDFDHCDPVPVKWFLILALAATIGAAALILAYPHG